MANVLADLAIESEAACLLAMRLAGATDRSATDAAEAALRRLALPLAKYWVCKRAAAHAAEALECLGGNGYVEESQLPRLYREAPVNAVWEGSGSVAALDALRAITATPESVDAYRDEVRSSAGDDRRLEEALTRLDKELADHAAAQYRARRLVEDMAVLLQGALLVRHGPAAVADAFVASRVDALGGRAFGTLPVGVDTDAVMARAQPHG
jgi:putative acyl-CoA dehydrogenase